MVMINFNREHYRSESFIIDHGQSMKDQSVMLDNGQSMQDQS